MNSSQGRPGVVATALFAAAAMVLSALPLAAAVGTTGAWIFPHSHQSDALGGTLSSSFYMGSNSSDWVSDSFFADSLADAANVQVDLYNPTNADLSSVQLFVAISDISLLTSIDFAGGDGGAVSVPSSDIGGGTPFLADGSTLSDHGVYPAYFTSYSVGSLAAGSAGIVTIWVNVTGDFAGGLIIHLDYAGVDDSGVVFTGPFDADMAIFENGEAEGEPPCVAPTLSLTGMPDTTSPLPGSTLTVNYETNSSDWDVAATGRSIHAEANATSPISGARVQVMDADAKIPDGDPLAHVNISFALSDVLLSGDKITIEAILSAQACGSALSASYTLTVTVDGNGTGDIHSAAWWQNQLERTAKSKKNAEFTKTEIDAFFQAIAAHSGMFTYGSWNGTAPSGDSDEGWLDIASLHDALDILKGKSGDSKKVRGIERQALALWLNVASGAVNLDTQVGTTRQCDDSDSDDDDGEDSDDDCENNHGRHRSVFEQRTGLSEPGDDFDTVGEILSFAEGQSADWKDGSGLSKADLKLGRLLCRAVNRGWLVPQ